MVNIGFPRTNCIRTDGLEPRIVPGPALWTHDNRAEPVRDLRSEGPPHPPTPEASTDTMHVVHPRAAGLDVHKMEITATVCSPEGGDPEAFSTLESGMRDLVIWLRGHGVTGAAMEATGWELPALEDAGIRVDLCAARQAGAGKPMLPTACGWLASASLVWRLRAWSCRVSSGVCAC